jgi:hypothetical protein
VTAARGEWVTDEEGLLHRAGLQCVDDVIAGMRATPESLVTAVTDTEALLEAAPR